MNIICCGTDPAGLYLAILLKRGDAAHRVTIRDTGLPDAGLEPAAFIDNPIKPPFRLRDAALQKAITAAAQAIDGVAVRLDREEVATEGQRYRAISVDRLRDILMRRAQALGCVWQSAAPDQEPGDADLVILAEGAQSPLRARHADSFRPVLAGGPLRFMLCEGKGKVPQLRFSFRRAPQGLVHAMTYPMARGRSTVLIEAPASVAEGFDFRGVKRLFADEPAVEGWKSRGGWQSCRTVSAGSWQSGRMLLLGRAAYTAHPSVGLDVRQSLEDAETLADLLLGGLSVEAALEQFVAARKPVASSLQRAAGASEDWLAQAANQAERLPFDQFALACLTRSLRITHSHVKGWAPDLVERIDRHVARIGSNGTPPPPMFAPLTLRGLTLANRIVVSPMCMYSAIEGTVNDFHLVHLGSRAQGGAGLVFTEMTDISPEGRISLNCAGLYAPEHVPAWKRVVDFVHRHSEAKIGVQLAHAGRKAALTPAFDGHKPLTGQQWDMLAPSAIPFAEGRQVPREMDEADLDRIREAFAAGARMADQAGFDMIELHMAHGYLLSSFISPLSNRRTDRYGGTLANRMRFPLEVLEAVRAAWPDAKPISVRISAFDWVEGGTTIEEAVEIGRLLRQAGNDVLDVSTGGVTSHRRPMVGRLYQSGFSDRIRNALGIATMTVGGVASWSDANSLIAAGRADLCLMARGALIDPYFVRHAAHAQGYDIAWPAQYVRAAELEMHD